MSARGDRGGGTGQGGPVAPAALATMLRVVTGSQNREAVGACRQ